MEGASAFLKKVNETLLHDFFSQGSQHACLPRVEVRTKFHPLEARAVVSNFMVVKSHLIGAHCVCLGGYTMMPL